MNDWEPIFVQSLAPTVDEQPVVNLQRWRILKQRQHLFLLGLTGETAKLRVTSPVIRTSRDWTAVTGSGRVYHLESAAGSADQAMLWQQFEASRWADVTDEVARGFDLMQ